MSKRLQQLVEKRDQIQARIRSLENRQKARQRRLLTRKKILLGALLEEWIKEDEHLRKKVETALVTFLKRAVDKEAFTGADGAGPILVVSEGTSVA